MSYVAPWSVRDADRWRRQTTDDDRRTASKTILVPYTTCGRARNNVIKVMSVLDGRVFIWYYPCQPFFKVPITITFLDGSDCFSLRRWLSIGFSFVGDLTSRKETRLTGWQKDVLSTLELKRLLICFSWQSRRSARRLSLFWVVCIGYNKRIILSDNYRLLCIFYPALGILIHYGRGNIPQYGDWFHQEKNPLV